MAGLGIAESVSDYHELPLPVPFIVPEGFDVRVYDSAAIDAAADDMVVHISGVEYDIRGSN
jgi:predicted Zn-dependent protease